MKSKIVANGARRRFDAKFARKRREELKQEFLEKYAAEIQGGGVIKRIWIRIMIKRLINQAVKDEFHQSPYNLNGRVG